MTWNLMHLARILKTAGGIPVAGNVIGEWRSGDRSAFAPNPEYR